ncbi:DUF2231 domain-containing protein [Kordiimonas sp.]|uniref:DUF2231 domain-containing protein n=1 Tax=Kordiimonas sp. TaxID=1970157 RepID=UPI003A90446B
MTDLIIPNWHPLLVHFTVGLTVSSALFLVLSKLVQKKHVTIFETAGKWTLWLGATITVLTVLAGIQAFNSVVHDDIAHKVMKVHRAWALGTAVAIILVAVWVYKSKAISSAIIAASLALTSLVGVTGYLGAELVYRHGLGVMRLPDTSGEGHDHGGNASHDHEGQESTEDEDHHDSGHSHDKGLEAVQEDKDVGHSHGDGGYAGDNPAQMADTEMHSDEADVHQHDTQTSRETSALGFVTLFQQALFSGDFDRVASSFAPDATVFENGKKEASLKGYLEHHLKPELPMLKSADRQVISQNVIGGEDLAIVTTSSILTIENKGQQHRFNSIETLGISEGPDGWKVVHAHWSSRPISDQK